MSNNKRENIKMISVSLSPEIIKKLSEGNYNKNKLIISLLEKYFKENPK